MGCEYGFTAYSCGKVPGASEARISNLVEWSSMRQLVSGSILISLFFKLWSFSLFVKMLLRPEHAVRVDFGRLTSRMS